MRNLHDLQAQPEVFYSSHSYVFNSSQWVHVMTGELRAVSSSERSHHVQFVTSSAHRPRHSLDHRVLVFIISLLPSHLGV